MGDRQAFVDAFEQGWALGASQGADAFLDHFVPRWIDPDVVLHQPLARPARGLRQFAEAFRRLFTALPDLTATVDGWRSTDAGVDVHLDFRGTLGRTPVRFRSLDRIVLRDGRIAERRAQVTLRPLLRAAATDRRAARALWDLLRPGA